MSNVYGYCPRCGGLGMSRERRLNGNDRCENGHSYPSSTAVANPLLPVVPATEHTADTERAAVVAWLRREVDDDADSACILAYAANGIERGEHLKGTQMTTEQSCYTCRWARGSVCDIPPCSEDMDVGIDGYALAAGCLKNKGMPLDRTIDCPGHERGEHRREEEK